MGITCDWCIREIGRPQRSAEEYDRMGIDIDPEDRCVILEARLSGTSQLHGGRALGHYHSRCYQAALQVLEDRRRWALGEPDGCGLEWQLADAFPYRKPAVLEPRHMNRILPLCRERGIDRDELAAALGTSRGAVGRWLKSYRAPRGWLVGITEKWAKRLVMFFDLDSTEDLFERELTGDAPAEEFEAVA